MNVLEVFLQEQQRPRLQISLPDDLNIKIERADYTGPLVVQVIKEGNVVWHDQYINMKPFFDLFGDVINTTAINTFFTMDAFEADHKPANTDVRSGSKRASDVEDIDGTKRRK